MKYTRKKKPVEEDTCEAVQWTGANFSEIFSFLGLSAEEGDLVKDQFKEQRDSLKLALHLYSLQLGSFNVSLNNWIIKGEGVLLSESDRRFHEQWKKAKPEFVDIEPEIHRFSNNEAWSIELPGKQGTFVILSGALTIPGSEGYVWGYPDGRVELNIYHRMWRTSDGELEPTAQHGGELEVCKAVRLSVAK